MSTVPAGTDGVAPVHNPDGRWDQWALSQVYMGPSGPGTKKFVPNVGDHVIDLDTNQRYRVAALNQTTFAPTLVALVDVPVGELSENDLLLGVGPGTQADTYRAYLDKSVVPYALCVDARLRFYGSRVSYVKIFRGSNLTGSGEVISEKYDNNGTLLGNNIAVETIATETINGSSYSIKSVPVCACTKDLPDNEPITVVAYADDAGVVSKRQLLIENSAFIRSTATSEKYVTGISLESPFLSQSDAHLIQCPMNVNVGGLALTGVVHYNDGSSLKYNVDGTKFELLGFDNYISSIVGQQIDFQLKYKLANNETAYGVEIGENRFLIEEYKARTTERDGKFTPKLFVAPKWLGSSQGYVLEWWMYDLEREVVHLVTPYVTVNNNSAAFSPLSYGVNQKMSVSVNLHDVNASYKSYIHTQTVDIVLLGAGTLRTTNWTIAYDTNQNPPFGQGNHADTVFTNSTLSTVNIGSGASSQSNWLDRMFRRTKPLYDPSREQQAPDPTHFALVLSNSELELPVSAWNATQTLSESLPNNGTLFVKFFKRTVDSDIQLAIAGLPVWQTN